LKPETRRVRTADFNLTAAGLTRNIRAQRDESRSCPASRSGNIEHRHFRDLPGFSRGRRAGSQQFARDSSPASGRECPDRPANLNSIA